MKKRKILIILISVLCLSLVIFSINHVKADSGWDSDYDSDWGSDWDSGSDWGSDWDSDYDSDWGSNWDGWDSDSNYHYSGSGKSMTLGQVLIFDAIVIIIIVVFVSKGSKKHKSKSPVVPAGITCADVSDEVLAKYGINKEEFKRMVYQKYVEIQEAWMNFDYDKLKDNLTDELYNSYVMQLDALKAKNQKNIMSDFLCVDSKIISVNDNNGVLNVSVYLRIQMYDYVVDSTKNVLRGSARNKIDIEYVITFVKVENSIKKVTCPNCGAELNMKNSGTCEYCRTLVVLPAKDYVMSKKTNVGQRRL